MGLCAAALLLSACGGGGGSAPVVAAQPNRAPTITGTPSGTVDTGSRYDFTPTGFDADGNRLSYSVSGKPAWATFDTTTGRLSGTPTQGQVGSFPNIVITVSDGQLSASLPAFQVQVTGTATLSWTAPTQNMDGSPLKDLVGYRVYYGTSAATLVLVDSFTNPAQLAYTMGGLAAGTWFFAVTAFNAAGIESDFSNIGSKTVY